MSLSTFHLFPQLPCELRLQIWEAAVRPSGSKNGLHRVFIRGLGDVVEDSSKFFYSHHDENWLTDIPAPGVASNGGSGSTANRSAHHWDAGFGLHAESRDG
jgi:hypothetical protein